MTTEFAELDYFNLNRTGDRTSSFSFKHPRFLKENGDVVILNPYLIPLFFLICR